ncbi:MAG: glycosyltransferase [Chitinispirillaceae bacterium]|nr:glycosyltransferase [Chitinispirillaceae bacterium]
MQNDSPPHGADEAATRLILHLLAQFDANPLSAEMCERIGGAYAERQQLPVARAYVEKALALRPGWENAVSRLATIQSSDESRRAENGAADRRRIDVSRFHSYATPQRVLFIGDYLYPPVGGAEKSMLTTLRRLVHDGHRCFAACMGPQGPLQHDGISIMPLENVSTIESIVVRVKPTIIFSQLYSAEQAVAIAKKHHIPSVLFIRSYEYFCATPLEFDRCDRNCSRCPFHPVNRTLRERFRRTIDDAGEIVCNSEFMRRVTRDFYGRDSNVVYPPVAIREHVVPHRTEGFILMNQPEPHKGGPLFFEIARRLPQLRFMTVGRGQTARLPNCINYGQTGPLVFFGHARLLLVPSIWPEPFGRIALEAMANGIPVLASRTGGLPEVIGDAGIVIDDYRSVDAWTDAVAGLLDDRTRYEAISRRARERSSRFDCDAQLDDLVPIVDSSLEISVSSSDRRVLDFYNRQYESVATCDFLFTQRRERLEGLCNMVRPGERYLDIGCADGAHMEVLSKRSIEGLGVDLSIPNIVRGAERFPHLTFIHGFAENLPLIDDLVDVAVMGDILEHLREPRAALREALRVASRGVAICVPVGEKTVEHIHPYPTVDSIEALFEGMPVSLQWHDAKGTMVEKSSVVVTKEKPWVYLRAEKTATAATGRIDAAAAQHPETVRDEWKGRESARDPQEVLRFAATAAIVEGPLVLEMACGNGDLSAAVALRGIRLHGIDIMESAVEWAGRTARARGVEARTSFSVGDAAQTGFPENHFDSVIIPEMIEHIRDPHRIILEAIRVVRVNGLILISVPDGRDPNPDHIRCFFPTTLKAELAQYTPSVTWYRLPFRRWLIATFRKTADMPLRGRDAFRNRSAVRETMREAPTEKRPLFGFNIVGPVRAGNQQGAALRGWCSLLIENGYPLSLYEVPPDGRNVCRIGLPKVPALQGYEMPYAISLFCMEPDMLERLFSVAPPWLRLKHRLNVLVPCRPEETPADRAGFLWGKTDAVAVTSPWRLEKVTASLPPRCRAILLPHPVCRHEGGGADRAFFKLPHNCVLFITFVEADLTPAQQQCDGLIAAFRRLPQEKDAVLAIVCERTFDRREAERSALLSAVGGDARIRLYEGMIGDRETQALFRCGDVACQLGRAPCSSVWLHEMMDCGKPVITCSCNVSDVITDTTACIVGCGNAPDGICRIDGGRLYERLEWCIDDPEARVGLGASGRLAVENHRQRLAAGGTTDMVAVLSEALERKRALFDASTRLRAGHRSQPLRVLFQNRPDMFERPGGDTTVLHALHAALTSQGVIVDISVDPSHNLDNYDIVHAFNTTLSRYTDAYANNAFSQGKPFAVTALQEDFPRYLTRARLFFEAFTRYIDSSQPQGSFDRLVEDVPADREGPFATSPLALCGAGAVFASGNEEKRIINERFPAARTVVAPFGVELSREEADTSLFTATHGIEDFVLCVGRLETRKNQLMLLKALENDPLTLVFVGGGVDYQPKYAFYCKKFKRKAPTLFFDRLDRAMLTSAFQTCRVHVLPSWYELPGLVTLEAAACGRSVVASSWGTVRDYTGEDIIYCEPDNVASIRNAVLKAFDSTPCGALAQRIRCMTWEQSAAEVLAAYQRLVENGNNDDPVERASSPQRAAEVRSPDPRVLETITRLVEEGKIREAVVLYDTVRRRMGGGPELLKFDRIMNRLREKTG